MMSLTNFSHWIFDMDGTLTLPMHDFEAIRQILNIPSGEPILEWIEKQPRQQAVASYQKLHDLEMELAYDAQPQPNIGTLLETLSQQGKSLAILTRNGKEITQATLAAAGISDYFSEDCIVTRDCCEPKPSPAGVHLLLQRWQIGADNVLLVGDYLYDIQAGADAGTKTLHFDQSAQFTWPEYTDYRAASIKEIVSLIV